LIFSLLTLTWLAATWCFIQVRERYAPFFFWLASLTALLFFLGLMYWFAPQIKKRLQINGFNHPRLIQKILSDIVLLRNTAELVEEISRMLQTTFHTERIHVIAKKPENGTLGLWNGDKPEDELPESVTLSLPWFKSHPGLWMRSKALADAGAGKGDLEAVFEGLEAEIILSLVQGDSLIGIISIGSKHKSRRFRPVELLFLERLVPMVTIALNNSFLYSYVGGLSRELWDANRNLDLKVRERTQALEETLDQMKKLNAEQNEFFAMASHNLGTPLTSIKAALTILLGRHPDMDPDLKGIIHENLMRLELLLQNIIEVSKIENNRLQLDWENLEMSALIRDAYLQARSLYPGKEVNCIFELDSSLAIFHADRIRLKTVFFHLLSNAFKYSASPANIGVSLQPADVETLGCYPELAKVTEHPDRGYAEIIIRDNGEGIPKDELINIFNKFHQVNSSAKCYQGHGLGLHLSKKIIECHGGAIRVESELGKGSAFRFVLPNRR